MELEDLTQIKGREIFPSTAYLRTLRASSGLPLSPASFYKLGEAPTRESTHSSPPVRNTRRATRLRRE